MVARSYSTRYNLTIRGHSQQLTPKSRRFTMREKVSMSEGTEGGGDGEMARNGQENFHFLC
jgi:hypothetical protein